MAKALVVAEKPSVARDIAKALGGFTDHESHMENDSFVVSWAVGHLLELEEPEEIDPKYKRWLLEDLPIVPEQFKLKVKAGQTDRVRTLKKLTQRPDVSSLINACDAGREGELIFRELVNYFATPKPVRRLWLQSMTADAIRTGFGNLHPGSDYDGLGDAAQCRSEADWLIGMNATRALTRRMKTRQETTAWSAGRVQTPTLALMVDRELEIAKHRSQPFWRILAQFDAPGHAYQGTWFDPSFKSSEDSPRRDDWITDEAQLEKILGEVRGKSGEATETRKVSKENAPPLFDLTSLQREGNRRFGYSARRTLAAAQRLYETHKLLTYPRTDSRCLPNDYVDHVNTVIEKLAAGGGEYGKAGRFLKANGLKNTQRVFDDSKVSDHFAIIPTEQRPAEGQLTGDDEKIYELVMRRFLAAFYPPAEWLQVERITRVASHSFRTRARFLRTPGWYEVYGRESTEDKALPALDASAKEEEALVKELSGEAAGFVKTGKGVGVTARSAEAEADKTRPPARITEARLLSLMEHAGQQVDDDDLSEVLKGKGLGTPATRAEIIENLVAKQYARRAEKALRATPKGILLIDLLRRIQVDRLASARLTGELEKHLQEVEQNARTRKDFMREIEGYAREIVERAKTFSYEELYRNEDALGVCPVCGGAVREQSRFYACEKNTGKDSECRFIIWKEKNGRYIDRNTITELLTQAETPELEGFLTAQGKGYSAKLRINEAHQLELVGDRTAGAMDESIPADAQPLCDCPQGHGCRVFETMVAYRCEAKCLEEGGRRKVGVTLPKSICSREISVEEALAFFTQGRTGELTEFMSRFGRPFAATLVLQPNGRHGFEFKPRPGREGREGDAAGKKKVAAKKTKTKAKAKSTGAKTKVAAATKSAPAAAKAPATAAAKKKKAAKKATKKKSSSASAKS